MPSIQCVNSTSVLGSALPYGELGSRLFIPQNIEHIVDKTAHLFSSFLQHFPALPSLPGAYAAEIKDVSLGSRGAEEVLSSASLTRGAFDWNERPEPVKQKIQIAFDKISADTRSGWTFNGAAEYGLAQVDEYKLIKTTIENAPLSQKDFYFMEIGAGNFEWEDALSKFVEEQKLVQEGRHIHIIGLRGETNLAPEIVKKQGYTVYNFGKFPIENLIDELEKRGLYLNQQVDAIVSRWTFYHLVDPLGTFVQAYNLLRPKTGHLMMDSFLFLTNQEELRKPDDDIRKENLLLSMEKLLLDTKAPFLIAPYHVANSMNEFILQKPDDLSLSLPMCYRTGYEPGWELQEGRYDHPTVFDRMPQDHDETILPSKTLLKLYSDRYPLGPVDRRYKPVLGDRPFYKWITKNKMWNDDKSRGSNPPYWLPLLETQIPTQWRESLQQNKQDL
jgi:hypothetical protein